MANGSGELGPLSQIERWFYGFTCGSICQADKLDADGKAPGDYALTAEDLEPTRVALPSEEEVQSVRAPPEAPRAEPAEAAAAEAAAPSPPTASSPAPDPPTASPPAAAAAEAAAPTPAAAPATPEPKARSDGGSPVATSSERRRVSWADSAQRGGAARAADPPPEEREPAAAAAAAAPSSPKCGSTERLTPRAVELLMASLGALTLRELRDALAALNGGANDAGPLQGHTRVLQLYFNSSVWRSIVSEKASTLRELEER